MKVLLTEVRGGIVVDKFRPTFAACRCNTIGADSADASGWLPSIGTAIVRLLLPLHTLRHVDTLKCFGKQAQSHRGRSIHWLLAYSSCLLHDTTSPLRPKNCTAQSLRLTRLVRRTPQLRRPGPTAEDRCPAAQCSVHQLMLHLDRSKADLG